MPTSTLLMIVAAWFVCIGLGLWLGWRHGHGEAGLALGALLGPIGVVVAALLPRGDLVERWHLGDATTTRRKRSARRGHGRGPLVG